MDKKAFITTVLGIDALTIGAFGTAAYESGRPIVGMIFLFVLVILSGIAFGFALNQEAAQKPVPKINPTDYTRVGVAAMKQAMKILEADRANDNPCPRGLCILLKHRLACELHTDYDCVTKTYMSTALPFFTYSNARIYGGAIRPEEGYWWDRDDAGLEKRIAFLKTMIEWQEEQ